MGQSITRIIPPELHKEESTILARVGGGERLRHYETARVAKNGRLVYVSLSVSPLFDKTGTMVGASTVARDITGQSEQRYRHLFKFIPISLWQLDARALIERFRNIVAAGVSDVASFIHYMDSHPEFITNVLDLLVAEEVNDVTVKMFGAKDSVELLGPMTQFWKTRPDTIRRAMVSRFRGDPYYEERTQVDTLDGRVIDVLFTAASTYLGTTLVGLVDLTDLVRTEQVLQQLQSEFARASRISTLGELTAAIAHEVNQPLTGLVSSGNACLRWLAGDKPNLDAARMSVERMISAGTRAGDVVGRIRAMIAKSPVQRAYFSVNDSIMDVIALIQGEAQRSHVLLQPTLADELPSVLGDRVQIQQVVLNLLLNAIEAMSTDDGRRLLTIASTSDGPEVVVTIKDTGPGLDPAGADRLFEAFYTTKKEGMGMGLAISRTIIQSHGGRLSAATNNPRGAVFQFALPVDGGKT